jgi:pyrimidine operon attenuation protein / uracil phosphoribosyltransferase
MSASKEPAQVMSASEIERTLVRLAHEVIEKSESLNRLAFIGIRRRGVPLAKRLGAKVKEIAGVEIPVGILDISLYRDDLSPIASQPVVNATEIPFSVTALDVVLVDDVLYTGRTTRAALNALFDQGRPSRVQMLTLIDRGHRELPIEASYVGRTVPTTDNQVVEVHLREIDESENVFLVERETKK